MGIFEIEAPNGQLLEIEGENAPTPEEAEDIFLQTIGGSQEKPINDSPLSSSQRVNLSYGTQDGNLNYLQENFEDAIDDPNDIGKYLVQKNGLWHRVDEQGLNLGDIQDMVGKAIPTVLSALGEVGGGTVGTFAAPGVGTGVGVVAGGTAGGAYGEVLRQREGQRRGTVSQEELDKIEVLTEGALGGLGAGFSLAVKRFGKQGLRLVANKVNKILGKTDAIKAVGKIKGTTVPKSISSRWDNVIGVSEGSTNTLLNHTDEVTDFGKWTEKATGSTVRGSKKALEIANDVVKFAKDTTKKFGDIKRVARAEANSLGKTVDPLAVIDTPIDEVTGETLFDFLSRKRVVARKGDALAIDSPMLQRMDKFLNQNSLTFDDIDIAIEQLDAVTKYNAIPDKERSAQGALKKIRRALKIQRNKAFGVEENFDELSGLIKSVQDADGNSLFKNVKSVDSMLRNIDGGANVRNKEIITQLGEINPAFKEILNKREIWKASNEFSSFLPSSSGGFGSGAGRANLLRDRVTLGATTVGAIAAGAPGAAVLGGGTALAFAPRVTPHALRALRLGVAGTKATAIQGTGRIGLRALGL